MDATPPNEEARLRALHRSGLLSAAASPELDEACREAKAHFGVAMALVTLVDRDLLVVRARQGADLERAPRSVAFCDHTIRSDDVLVVPDLTRDPRFAANPLVTAAPFARFYAGAPLVTRRGIRLGALCLVDLAPRAFSLGDRAELTLRAEEVVHHITAQEFKPTRTPQRR